MEQAACWLDKFLHKGTDDLHDLSPRLSKKLLRRSTRWEAGVGHAGHVGQLLQQWMGPRLLCVRPYIVRPQSARAYDQRQPAPYA